LKKTEARRAVAARATVTENEKNISRATGGRGRAGGYLKKNVRARARGWRRKTEVDLRSGERGGARVCGAQEKLEFRGDWWCAVDETDEVVKIDSNLTRIKKSGRNPVEIGDGDFNCCNILNSDESCC
jgi:hypothetical protein